MDIQDVKLSDLEERLLAAAVAADGKRLTIAELADKCRCKPATVIRKMQDEVFKQLFMETLRGSLIQDVPDILTSFVNEAKGGSFKHGELILDMVGIHKKEVNANVGVKFRQTEGDEDPFGSDKDKASFLKGILARIAVETVREPEDSEDTDE